MRINRTGLNGLMSQFWGMIYSDKSEKEIKLATSVLRKLQKASKECGKNPQDSIEIELEEAEREIVQGLIDQGCT